MKSMSPKFKKTGKIVIDVVFWVFFVFALAFTVLAFTARASAVNGFPQIGDKTLLTVESNSMKSDEGFKKGDLIISKVIADDDKAISELKEGDVITFRYLIEDEDSGTATYILVDHRIIEIEHQGESGIVFITHGDNNPEGQNERILPDKVLAVWTGDKINGLGGFIHFLQPPQWGFFVFIILPLAGFLAYEVVILVKSVREIQGKDKRSITKAEEELIKQQAIEEFLKKQEAEKAAQEESNK